MTENKIIVELVDDGEYPYYSVSKNGWNMACFPFKLNQSEHSTWNQSKAMSKALDYSKQLKAGTLKRTLILEL